MDEGKYYRLQKLGGIFQQLRNQQRLSTLEKLTLEVLEDINTDYLKCLNLFGIMANLTEATSTRDIAILFEVSPQTMTQTLRALKEGGFDFKITMSTANWYDPLIIPENSMLQYLINTKVLKYRISRKFG